MECAQFDFPKPRGGRLITPSSSHIPHSSSIIFLQQSHSQEQFDYHHLMTKVRCLSPLELSFN